uniref:von Willebrand factor D and EGF domain-containing protein n=2 Tax=Lygus hesperus TaxID=30085 RepID=A0A0A9X1J9_LYGHE
MPTCEPICTIPCVNAQCVAPGECECLPGFGTKISDHVCEPVCNPECMNADCVMDNQCTCWTGFKRDEDQSHKCSPHCSHECVDGYCAKPETCACNASYSLSSNGTVCEPVCSLECENGKCVAPDMCECAEGFVGGENWNLCEPYCPEPCENALCTAPSVCTCLKGYDYDHKSYEGNRSQCVPHCSKECINGECIAPEECGCNQGFDMDAEVEQCVPECSNGCDNGKCVAPEKCDCDDGYRNLNESCVPHCDHQCVNGNCSAPNECSCNNGTLKASSYHCLLTCSNTPNDHCFHESLVPIPSAVIHRTDEDPYVDFPTEQLLSVPCKHISSIHNDFLEGHYQCYSYLDFEEESLTVVCSVDSETMVSSESYNQTRNLTVWITNTTMQPQSMNVLFVHRDVSSYCTAQLCPNSNRTLYLNALSPICVCMKRPTDGIHNVWPSWVLMAASGVSFILFVTLLAAAWWRYCKEVSYTVNTRHNVTSGRCDLLQGMEGSEIAAYEQMESVELSNEDAPIL